MTCSNCNTVPIAQLGHIVGMNTVNHKTNNSCLLIRRWPEKTDTTDIFKYFMSPFGK